MYAYTPPLGDAKIGTIRRRRGEIESPKINGKHNNNIIIEGIRHVLGIERFYFYIDERDKMPCRTFTAR